MFQWFEKPSRRWLVWGAFIVLWTVLLVIPMPTSGPIARMPVGRKYILTKSVHVCAYGLFAVLTGWLSVRPRYRWLLLFVVMAHGTATELIQFYFTSRDGNLDDVGFDNFGVLLGLIISWKWWTRE